MLKLEDIRFPITFTSRGIGEITFDSADAVGVITKGLAGVTAAPLSRYIKWHNMFHRKNGDCAYTMAPQIAKPAAPLPKPTYWLISGSYIFNEAYDSLALAIEAAEQKAIKQNVTVRVVSHAATIAPKHITTTEVTYA